MKREHQEREKVEELSCWFIVLARRSSSADQLSFDPVKRRRCINATHVRLNT